MIPYKSLAKFPRVILETGMKAKILDWFEANCLSPLVPPIFNRFVIEYEEGARYSVPVSDAERYIRGGFERRDDYARFPPQRLPREFDRLEAHEWLVLRMKAELLVDYDPSLTKLRAVLYEDAKVTYTMSLDYEDLDAKSGTWRGDIEGNFEEEDIEGTKEHSMKVLRSIIAIQSYLLYHHSEEIAAPKEIKVKSRNDGRKSTGKKKKQQPVVKIKHSVQRRIIIRESEKIEKRAYNYKTLAWNVRGHYARRGADKHLTYIAPYICRRDNSKAKPQAIKYYIANGDKEEQ